MRSATPSFRNEILFPSCISDVADTYSYLVFQTRVIMQIWKQLFGSIPLIKDPSLLTCELITYQKVVDLIMSLSHV